MSGRLIVAATLVVFVAIGLVPDVATADGDRQRLERLDRERARLADELVRSNAELWQARLEQTRLDARVRDLGAQLSALATSQHTLTGEIAQLDARIVLIDADRALAAARVDSARLRAATARARADAAAAELGRVRELLAAHARLSYRLQPRRSADLDAFLGLADVGALLARFRTSLYLERADALLVERAELLGQMLKTDARRAASEETSLTALQQSLQALALELRSMRDMRTERARLLADRATSTDALALAARTASDEKVRQQQVLLARQAELRAAEERNDAAVLELTKELARRAALDPRLLASGVPDLDWPIAGPVTSWYGWRSVPWLSFHNGIDIAAPLCAPVRAGAAGVVMTVGRPWPDGAEVVIVAHSRNASTVYAHLADSAPCPPPVRVGQRVGVGTIIGYVGMTGVTTGPHLHFSLIVDGAWVDPAPRLP